MQVKYAFDRETLIKIGKGALIAGTGSAALYILNWLGTIDMGGTITPIIAAIVPILVNAIKEWMRGK